MPEKTFAAMPYLSKLDVVKRELIGDFQERGEELFAFRPFSKYDNDASTRDTADVINVYILDGEGESLAKVLAECSVRYSDGSRKHWDGETVKEALNRLPVEKRSRVGYVLVVKQSTVETVTALARTAPDGARRTRMDKDEFSAVLHKL